jgi:hypothetical protein
MERFEHVDAVEDDPAPATVRDDAMVRLRMRHSPGSVAEVRADAKDRAGAERVGPPSQPHSITRQRGPIGLDLPTEGVSAANVVKSIVQDARLSRASFPCDPSKLPT